MCPVPFLGLVRGLAMKVDWRIAAWMRGFQSCLLTIRPALAGKVDWHTARYLHDSGLAPAVAAAKYLECA